VVVVVVVVFVVVDWIGLSHHLSSPYVRQNTPVVGNAETGDAVQRAFRSLLAALVDLGYTIVLVLDDLQWVDRSSLELLHSILSCTALHNVLVAASFRPMAVTSSHPLSAVLESCTGVGGSPWRRTEVHIEPLSHSGVMELIHDMTWDQSPPNLEDLAHEVLRRTGGVPFEVIQVRWLA